MSINRFGAAVLAALIVALPAYANDGGGGKGDAAQRMVQQQQQQEEQQQEEEQITPPPESILDSIEEPAKSTAPTDPASVAARDFYTSVAAGLDPAIKEMRERIAAREKKISELDLKAATDFVANVADDKTPDDKAKTAEEAFFQMVNGRNFDLAKKGLPIDPNVPKFVTELGGFQAEVQALQQLEAMKADMVNAARAYGAVIE